MLGTKTINSALQKNPIAIIGMASLFPEAENLQQYWENILNKIDCIKEVPDNYWNPEHYYDPNPRAADKTYCKRGGFIPKVNFNPMEFGMPPNVLEVTDVSQLISLVIAKQAMEDAGYGEKRQFARDRVGVIIGEGAMGGQSSMPYRARMEHPVWRKVLKSSGISDEDSEKIIEKILANYKEWQENSFPGMLGNIIAGRIANRLDLGGTNCTIDAACASSLAAFKMAVSELLEDRSEMMLTGGVDLDNTAFTYLCFSKTPALSLKQEIRPFDIDSQGMMLGEGIGMIILKRLENAERDGDRIYAVIRGIGTSSDGKYKSIYAPSPQGQIKALQRAYRDAGFAPKTVKLIEAHGTGTLVGDPAEFTALNEVFSQDKAQYQSIALGSVKSQIGHTKGAAGAAGIIKAALALHHKVLPATINITKPNPKLNIEKSPFYLNTQTRPWISLPEEPRRAAVSSFGFGGTNYHVILEEHQNEHDRPYRLHNTGDTLLLFAATPTELLHKSRTVLEQLRSDNPENCYREILEKSKTETIPLSHARVGFIAASIKEAILKLEITVKLLETQSQPEWEHPQGVYYRQSGLNLEGKVVALFPGQGSQYLEMGRELAINFPQLRQVYSQMDRLLTRDGQRKLSETVFPTPVFTEADRVAQNKNLRQTEYAQPAIGAFSLALYQILQQAGFKADFCAGHSFGELTALWAAGVLNLEDYLFLVKARGQAMGSSGDAGGLLAVSGDLSNLETILEQFSRVTIANYNSDNQTVLAGEIEQLEKLKEILDRQGNSTTMLPVSAAFHSSFVSYALKPFGNAIASVEFKNPQIPIYSNITSKAYPAYPNAIKNILKQQILNPVKFKQQIENIYADGGYCFVEIGPRNILTRLVKDILGDRPHLAVSLNASRQKDSDRQFREGVLQLRVAGLSLQELDRYQQPAKIASKKDSAKLIIPLDGINYVSEKTKQTALKALENGHKTTSVKPELKEKNSPKPIEPKIKNTRKPTMKNPSIPQKQLELPTILETIQTNLDRFDRHQEATVNIHQQYLEHQKEYTKIFFELMQQQQALLSSDNYASATEQNKTAILESLEGNMMRFHEHQSQTLAGYEKSIAQQTESVKSFCQLTQQQCNIILSASSLADRETTNNISGKIIKNPAISTNSNGNGQQVKQALETSISPNVSVEKIVGNGYKKSEITQERIVSNGNGKKITSSLETSNFSNISVGNGYKKAATTENKINGNGNGKKITSSLETSNFSNISVGNGYKKAETTENKINSNGNGQQIKSAVEVNSIATISTEKIVSNGHKKVEITQNKINSNGNGQQRKAAVEANNIATISTEKIVSNGHKKAETSLLDYEKVAKTLLDVVSEKTGYPPEMLEMDMDIEADLGIDSIKRVEILGALQEMYPDVPPPNPEEIGQLRTLAQIAEAIATLISAPQTVQINYSATETTVDRTEEVKLEAKENSIDMVSSVLKLEVKENTSDRDEVKENTIDRETGSKIHYEAIGQTLLNVVSEKTGYPPEMLEMDMDIEADLGIDSIKRVEILGALQEMYPDVPPPNPEEIGQLRTLAQIAEAIGNLMGGAIDNNSSSDRDNNSFQPQEAETETEPTASQILLKIVSDKTGYPLEMLEMDMDIEADLGIDKVKGFEIFKAMSEHFPNTSKMDLIKIAQLKTLGQIIDYIEVKVAQKKTSLLGSR